MIFHIRSKYTAIGECYGFNPSKEEDANLVCRSEGDFAILLPIRYYRATCHLPRL